MIQKSCRSSRLEGSVLSYSSLWAFQHGRVSSKCRRSLSGKIHSYQIYLSELLLKPSLSTDKKRDMGNSDSRSAPEEDQSNNPIFCNALPEFDPIPSPSKHTGRSKSRSVSPTDDGTIPYYVPSSRGPSVVDEMSPGRRSSFLRNNSLDEVGDPLFIFASISFDF